LGQELGEMEGSRCRNEKGRNSENKGKIKEKEGKKKSEQGGCRKGNLRRFWEG